MAKEIERKYLVDISKIDISQHEQLIIQQGYLSKDIDKTIRIRIQSDKGFLTVKTKTRNITRDEYEYEIPLQDALELIKICGKSIFKKKWKYLC
jgi:adenylate cyclase